MSKVFLDTNILVYSLDQSDAGKQKKCRELIKRLIGDNSGVISTQVMQEFFIAATAKLGAGPLLASAPICGYARPEDIDNKQYCWTKAHSAPTRTLSLSIGLEKTLRSTARKNLTLILLCCRENPTLRSTLGRVFEFHQRGVRWE